MNNITVNIPVSTNDGLNERSDPILHVYTIQS